MHRTLLLLFFCPCVAFAWGPDGHRIVADIATAHLSPKAQAAVAEILDGSKLDEVADWPDEVRREHADWSPWHFIDIPFDSPALDLDRDGRKGNNIVEKLTHFAEVLNDQKASHKDRAEALKFVVHFVGDIHQPMHCVNRNDAGGNSRLVFFGDQGRAVNLHALWDSTMLRHMLNGANDKVFAAALDARVSKADAAKLESGSPEAWANETHDLAVKDAYTGIPADGPPPKLGDAYVSRAEQDVKQQLTRAGIRLGWLLNRVLN